MRTGMKICPDCRNPVHSMMLVDGSPVPEHYCERCCRAVKPKERLAAQAKPKILVAA